MVDIDLTKEVIGIPLSECLHCGKTEGVTRHHVIMRALNPKRNVTIPLCEEHKDICHPIIKQPYIPPKLRERMGKLLKKVNDTHAIAHALRNDFKTTYVKVEKRQAQSPLES